jgi:23S rRNA maturation mini-RNase III
MTANPNLPLSEQFRIVAKKYVDADAAANMLEESKSAFLANLMLAQGDMPVSRAEMNVKASDQWSDYIGKMVRAREQAALLKVQLEYLRMKFQEWNSEAATKRAEMKL